MGIKIICGAKVVTILIAVNAELFWKMNYLEDRHSHYLVVNLLAHILTLITNAVGILSRMTKHDGNNLTFRFKETVGQDEKQSHPKKIAYQRLHHHVQSEMECRCFITIGYEMLGLYTIGDLILPNSVTPPMRISFN